MESKTEVTVRHYELDAYGHVNNANYLNYLEHARSEFLKDIGLDYKSFVEAGYGVYVIKVCITYKSPALPDQVLQITTKPIKRRKASGTFFQQIWHEDRLICEAEVTWASIGKDGTMAPIPEQWDVEGLNPE